MLKIVEDEIKSTAKRVLEMVFYGAARNECLDNPEFLAYEILDLSEVMAVDFSIRDGVIREILKYDGLSNKTKQIVRELS